MEFIPKIQALCHLPLDLALNLDHQLFVKTSERANHGLKLMAVEMEEPTASHNLVSQKIDCDVGEQQIHQEQLLQPCLIDFGRMNRLLHCSPLTGPLCEEAQAYFDCKDQSFIIIIRLSLSFFFYRYLNPIISFIAKIPLNPKPNSKISSNQQSRVQLQ